MPVKKATRSTRSTRTTKASSKVTSSEVVFDENADVAPEVLETKKKATKSTATSKKVLGDRNAPNNVPASPLKEKTSSQLVEAKSTSAKSAKTKKGKKAAAATEDTDEARATTPVPSSPPKRRLPEEQVQAFLQNYDLEAESRLSRLRASLEISVQSSITRMRLAIERIPRAVRQLTLAEFIDEYGADLHTFMGRAPVQHLKDTQKEWDQIKEECSPVKSKRSKKDDDATSRSSKAARTTNPTAASTASRAATTSSAAGRKRTTRTTKPSSRSNQAPTSPSPLPASSKPAPTLPTFQPDLPKQALQTPKPRMARAGEVIQWQSINGSPICGIIAEDGTVRPVTFA